MEQKKITELTNEELLIEAKKMKSTMILNAVLIGFLIGVMVYSITKNGLGFLTLILLFVAYKLINRSNYDKKELEKILIERGLKYMESNQPKMIIQNSPPTLEKFLLNVKIMRMLAIILTIVQFSFISAMFFTNFWINFFIDSYGNLYYLGIDLLISGIFIWFTWKKMPFERKIKVNNTFLVIFFGFIGLWLCTPNQSELKKLIEDNFGENCQDNSN